ncbi:MAG: hypothetical protein COV52_09530 [Gammaproteobacteria bacterium CG11_big_fil_rev_8_21_14_0_20_46_22]|nr:MAG: hypothetical protein COW05_03640 [Gammaproteobacteria bacterium CG12_big_fil_rev_8_21_14_0_65_46_12]PIR10288.1 MAG: hypothetical protein COV52_09530 [Gammaproteobacteria bacterium CG11_big_fil_rev_8_21_14_0_20_46_22]
MSIDRKLTLSPWLHTLQLHARSIMNGLGQLSRSPLSSIAIFIVIGVALALPMGLFVALDNVSVVSYGLKGSGQVSLYLQPDVTGDSLTRLEQSIERDQAVASVQYISPEEGLKDFLRDSGFSKALANLKQNPLPGVLIVEPSPALQKTWQVQQLYSRLQNLPGVSMAQLDLTWLKRLHAIMAIGHRFVSILMFLFFIAVVFVVFNTITLTTKAYHDEIRIIKLLGGSDRFIRLPFLYSGIIYGLTGAIMAWFIVDIGVLLLSAPIERLATLYGSAYSLSGMDGKHTLYLLLSGVLLGYLGAWFAVRRRLKAVDFKPAA